MAFRRGTFLFVLIIIFKNFDWRRTDVGPMSAGDINPTSKRDVGPTSHGWYWPNVGQTSAQHMFPCSFYSLHILAELLCAQIVPMLEAAINYDPVLLWLQTYCTNMKTWFILTHLRPRQNGRHFPDAIFKCIFLNENIQISIKFSLKYVCKAPIDNIYQR